MAMWVNTTDETYYKSKECANNISFGLPITDGLNFGGFIWERDTNLDFTQPLTVQLLEVLSGYLLPIIDQPIGGIFANYVVGYDNNGELYLYFRDFDYAGLTADICNFILRISDGSNYVYSKYVYNIGFGNCSCIAGDTTTIESTPISTYDCCGAYYGLPNGIEDGDSSLLASNLMEIYGKIRTAPSSTKIKRFSNCKVRSIDFAPKKRITWAAVPADYMETIDCILANGNILANGEEYEVDSDTNFDTSDANCFCMFSQDIRLSECNCVKNFGCDIDENIVQTCTIFGLTATQSLPCFDFNGTIVNGYTLNWFETGTLTNIIVTGDPIQGTFSVPAGTLTIGVLLNVNTPATITLTSDTTDPLNPLCSTSITITPPDCPMLRMKFLPNSPELGFTLVQWNTAFDLPANGTAFTGLTVVGDNVYLTNGGAGTFALGAFTNSAMYSNNNILEFDDSQSNYLASGGAACFYGCNFLERIIVPVLSAIPNNFAWDCVRLIHLDAPLVSSVGNSSFTNAGSLGAGVIFNLPLCLTAGQGAFEQCKVQNLSLQVCTSINNNCLGFVNSLVTLNLPLCTSLGSSTGDDNVFVNISGITATITVPIFLQTCNAGNPDGDLVTFLANNPASTIIYL